METKKILKSGYTTGSHATSALKAALFSLLTGKTDFKTISINLPEGDDVELDIGNIKKTDNYVLVSVVKSDNDDVDVTKGCKIICWAGYNLEEIPYLKQEISHQPHNLQLESGQLLIWAGKGLGIVTKKGLDAPVGFPAINPVPLGMMKESADQVFKELNIKDNKEIFIVFEVENGEEIAKNTANAKAGILGGLSFIGKKGVVKPISSEAYLDSLAAEINVAAQNGIKNIIFTMGNSSLKFAENNYQPEEYIVEIGNFVFDSLKLLAEQEFNKVTIVTNIGKLTKIAQGKKNTNNRYGDIDFNLVRCWLEKEEFPAIITSICDDITIIGSLEKTIIAEYSEYSDKFYQIIINNALDELKNWAIELNLNNIQIEIILTDGDRVKYRKSY
ncbi:MAG: hypothetical protein A2255_02355 [Candidatus Melainabacteria bacterium RIFOXYA2_FULL_32_9]|nr:MAG: hypothetical protein A2255_02355 [Candidatus Melainabacteria bacterium RIFOXYA2_FULL_32_9]